MNFKIDDILNNTIDGVPKDVLTGIILKVLNEETNDMNNSINE